MTTINNYAVSLSLDADQYIRNSSLSRKETAALKREINSARSPADKYERSVNRLSKALEAGAIDQGTYNRLLESAKQKLDRASTSTKHLESQNINLTKSVKRMAAAYLTFATAQKGIAAVREQMEAVDEVAKSARSIGETFLNLEKFRFAAGEFAGLEGQAATTMLAKLTQRVGEASLGIGEASQTFQRLNLNAADLVRKSPVEQFRAIASAIQEIENPTERVALATKLFEEQGTKLLPLLMASTAQYEESANQIERLGLGLSEVEAANLESANDAIGRMDAALSGITRQVAMDLIPAIHAITDALVEWQPIIREAAKLVEPFAVGMIGLGAALNDLSSGDLTFSGTREARERYRDAVVEREYGMSRVDRNYVPDWYKPEPPKPLSGDVLSGLGTDGASLASNIGSMLGSGFSGAFSQLGQTIMASDMMSTERLIEAQQEDPAIKSLEVGTQEAYQYLTQEVGRQADIEAQKAERERENQERIAKGVEETNKLLDLMKQAFEDNGPKKIR